ncbi:MAG: hypothetical protein WBB15_18215 [Ornithinimicrobium sp.]
MVLQRQAGNAATTAHIRRAGGSTSTTAAPTVQRGEAGVHQDIELTATGVDRPAHLHEGLDTAIDLTPDQQRAMEMYAGNWMRDYSQFLVPAGLAALATVPQRPHSGGAGIGNRGAESLIQGILRALASLEFGPEITGRLMSGPNIGMYRPEEHMDHPAGMSLGGDVLVRGTGGALRPAGMADRVDPTLAGSAVPGPQVHNPALFQIGAQGLSQHIYNTTESVKFRLIQAHSLGPSPEGRMQLGAGLHGVEDYFSHSNFIEVALNSLLGKRRHAATRGAIPGAPVGGPVVDTLFDESVGTGRSRRQAVTTGTFTALDTQISIAHVLLPKLPTLFTSVDRAIDRTMLALEKEGSSWADIKEQLATDRAGAAFVHLLDGMDAAGMELPSARLEKWQVPDLPDILPDAVENGLEGRWLATGVTPLSLPPSAAVPSYVQLYADGKQIWEHREEIRMMLRAVVRLIDGMPAWMTAGLGGLRILRNQLVAAASVLAQDLGDLVSSYTQQLKQQMRSYLMDTVEKLLGLDDIPASKRAHLEEWLAAVQHGTESRSHATALEHQLSTGDLQIPEAERSARLPSGALPPSHSEVSKDHPDHRDSGAEDAEPGQGHVHGASLQSAFFDLHRDLAIEADRHMVSLMEGAWSGGSTADTRISHAADRPHLDPEDRRRRDRRAAELADSGARAAEAEGRYFAQSSGTTPPEMAPVLNAVDLYISHPADSTWWHPVVERHFGDQARLDQLVADIRTRNRTRASRGRWNGLQWPP